MPWWVVETLGNTPRVVWSLGRRRDWSSPSGILRDTGIDGGLVVNAVRTSKKPLDFVVPSRRERDMRVVAKPTLDANQTVAAVALWIDTPSRQPDAAPKLAAVMWDRATLTAQSTPEAHLLRADSSSGFEPSHSLSNLLRNTYQFADVTDFLEFCFANNSRRRFQSELDVRHDSSRELMKWQIVAHSGRKHVGILLHDITQFEPVSVGTQGLRALPTNHDSHSGVALVCLPDAKDPQVAYWLTPIPSQIANSGSYIHPLDAPLIREAQAELANGASSRDVKVRVRSADHWVPCNLVCRSYPTTNVGVIVIVCDFSVGDSSRLEAH